jgi:hypothetical protein
MTDSPAKWAIITGASSGIGKALAFEFAAGGFSLVIAARNETALKEIAAECASKYRVQVDVVAADLSQPQSADRLIGALSPETRKYDVLVNNAGFGIHGDFVSTSIDQNIELLNLQLAASLKLTRAVLPGMIERRYGRILNVASVYSWAAVPQQSVYAACKAFLQSFSASLHNELKGSGVTVTIFAPGVTQTEFRSRAGITAKRDNSGITAEEAARIACAETLRGTHIVVPGFLNRLFVFLARRLPLKAVPGIVRLINRQRLD